MNNDSIITLKTVQKQKIIAMAQIPNNQSFQIYDYISTGDMIDITIKKFTKEYFDTERINYKDQKSFYPHQKADIGTFVKWLHIDKDNNFHPYSETQRQICWNSLYHLFDFIVIKHPYLYGLWVEGKIFAKETKELKDLIKNRGEGNFCIKFSVSNMRNWKQYSRNNTSESGPFAIVASIDNKIYDSVFTYSFFQNGKSLLGEIQKAEHLKHWIDLKSIEPIEQDPLSCSTYRT